CWYWIRKLQALFLAGDFASAIAAAEKAQALLWTVPTELATADHGFFFALSHAASCDRAGPVECGRHLQAMASHHRQLQMWAENCPETFAHRAALVGAEIARLEGRALEAEQLYERALRSSKANGFVHDEALANELAARFYSERDLTSIAQTCLRNARYCYLRWGAEGKVRQLERAHPYLREGA